ncbi:MAG TPA: purine-nucleoside phosphorylase [Candidatus Marinimicrobia bacterium]|nr:purine-nucleoside phosphorylase [Candidatus Neomarinimicrobiota bacterium]HRS52408.1 purine-nucleoside phosphorylase [Candidatus Neomarinimicrobiota bacterium]
MRLNAEPEKISEAVEFLQKRLKNQSARIAVVLGSGLGYFAEQLEIVDRIDHQEIPHYPTSTVVGHAGKFISGYIAGIPLIAIQGRTHLYEGRTLAEVTFYVEILARLGIRYLILTNAAGGIDPNLKPGSIVLLTDYISFTQIPLTPDGLCQTASPFCGEMIAMVREIARRNKIELQEGIYCWTLGPSFETPAEIQAARKLGATVVGMSTVPEAVTAQRLGLKVLGISLVTNLAAGISESPITHEEVQITADKSKKVYSILMEKIIIELAKNDI